MVDLAVRTCKPVQVLNKRSDMNNGFERWQDMPVGLIERSEGGTPTAYTRITSKQAKTALTALADKRLREVGLRAAARYLFDVKNRRKRPVVAILRWLGVSVW